MIILESHKALIYYEQQRVVDYCVGIFPQLQTKNAVKKAIKREEIVVNGSIAESGRWINSGDQIDLIEGSRKQPKPFPLPLEIVFEDEYLVVVNKPSGLVVSGNQYRTLESALIGQATVSKEPDALGWAIPVHRLDSPTSGLIICAKTYAARIKLMADFKERKIKKRYHAVVGNTVPIESKIDFSIEGKAAESLIVPVKTVKSLRSEVMSLTELYPATGRTHQLRIHCKEAGHPIVGDTLYGKEGNTLLHKGLFLAATLLEFEHPILGIPMEIKIDVPYKFEALLEREERRWTKFKST